MEDANIDESDMDVTTFSDVELAKKLRELGANIGPITHSTRSVYQHKLQRWLKYGSNHSMSVVSSPSHSSVEESPPSPSSPVHEEELSFDEVNNIEQLKQIENKCTDNPVSKKSDANMCKDSSLAYSLSAQLERDGENNKEIPEKRRKNLPVVSQEDIELVDRVMASSSQSASYEATSYQSFSYQSSASNDFSTESFNEEPVLRSRYVTHNVTPRPSLKSYRDNIDKNFSGDRTTPGRGSFISSHGNELSAPLTEVNSSTRPCLISARWMMLLVTVVGLVIVAVVYNMEPSYVYRLEQ